jgi:hypothetical protein
MFVYARMFDCLEIWLEIVVMGFGLRFIFLSFMNAIYGIGLSMEEVNLIYRVLLT